MNRNVVLLAGSNLLQYLDLWQMIAHRTKHWGVPHLLWYDHVVGNTEGAS